MADQTKPDVSWMNARAMSQLLMVAIALGVLAYAFLRAEKASFTHDESLSYLRYPHQALGDILSHKEAFTNNHLLNTLGMKYSERLFGTSELSLRLPNLIALVMYMVYAALLVRSTSPWIGSALFVILITNVDIMELFTLARGYGLSFGFMLMAIYHLWTYLNSVRPKDAVLFHAACMLAVLSNFTLLDLYAAALGLLALAACLIGWMLPQHRVLLRRNIRLQAVLVLLAVFGLWEPVRQVIAQNQFDFGGQQGFYRDTLRSVIFASFQGLYVNEALLLFFQVLFTAVMLLALAFIARKVAKKDHLFVAEHSAFVVVTGVLFLTCVVSTLQHVILGTDHLTARFAKFLLPLLGLHIGLGANALTAYRGRAATMLGLLLLAGLSVSSFIHASGYYRSNEWQYDVETKDMMNLLAEHHEGNDHGQVRISIGNTWVFEPTINFYRVIRHMDALVPAHRNGPQWNEDYLYVDESQFAQVDTVQYAMLKAFRFAGTRLYAKRTDADVIGSTPRSAAEGH